MAHRFAFLLLSCTGLVAHAQTDTITVGSLQRIYTVRLPSVYDGVTPLPLVIAMHGGFGSGTQLENQSQLTAKAEEAGFIVAYPDGVPNLLGIRTWNAGGCCGYAMNNNIDDVGFIDALLDTLQAQYAIDGQRVYATGMSNGGFMSYRLACELSHRIAAIAPVSASMTINVCQPVRPVPVIAMHSYLDTNVPYLGGVGNGASNHYNSPQDSVQTAFALHANCAVLNDTILDDSDMTVIRWHDCDCQQEMLLYMTRDGGHSWPGGQGTGVGDPPSTVIDANDLMWDFFQQYTLGCITTGIGTSSQPMPGITISPQPSGGIVLIRGEAISSVVVIDALGRTLRIVNTTPASTITLDLGALHPGRYVARITDRHGRTSTHHVVLVR